ncbi:MAG: hypothetical protein V4538_01800 [Bacteroidota bacterium]
MSTKTTTPRKKPAFQVFEIETPLYEYPITIFYGDVQQSNAELARELKKRNIKSELFEAHKSNGNGGFYWPNNQYGLEFFLVIPNQIDESYLIRICLMIAMQVLDASFIKYSSKKFSALAFLQTGLLTTITKTLKIK